MTYSHLNFARCILKSGFLLTLLSLFYLNTLTEAQTVGQKPDLKFQRIYEGLISNRVSAVYQDSFGYMWFGTHSGLHRYDGIEFHIYSTNSDSTSINDNFIGAIYEDSEGRLWIGTGNGMARYNRSRDNFTRFQLPAEGQVPAGETNMINSILEDQDGRMWISGSSKGLYYFDRDQQQFFAFGELEDVTVNEMASGNGNTLWLATTDNGLGKVNITTGEVEFYRQDPSDPRSITSSFVFRVATDQEGVVWAGTRNSGLNKLVIENGQPVFDPYLHEPGNPNSLGNNSIHALHVDPSNNLWVGNDNGGLHLLNKNNDTFFRYESEPDDPLSLSHDSIWSIFHDREGRLWIGTAQSGINVHDRFQSKFTHYYQYSSSQNSLNNNIIRDFQEKEDGDIWIATDGGGLNLFKREQRVFQSYQNNPDDPQSLRSDAVISLNIDNEGTLWVGTWGGGMNLLLDEERGVFETFKERFNINDYPFNHVFDVHFDDPYIWLAAFEEGLYRYNRTSGVLRLFNSNPDNPESLISNYAVRIFEDSMNNLWIATNEGLSLLKEEDKEEGIFRTFSHTSDDPHSIAGNTVNQIFEDRNQTIWAVTTSGLSKYVGEEDRFENYYQSDGLPSNELRSITEDDDGNFWIGSISGITKFDPANKTFINYDQSDGLQGNEFSRYSVHKTQKGELLFGGMNGFNLFHPDDIRNNPNTPEVYLTDLKLFNESVNLSDPDSPLQKQISVTDTLTLSYQQNVITFDFIALNYTQPEHNQYAYWMEGFEEDWNYVGAQRNATYTNLRPGEYVFHVKASNNDGIWNEEGTSLRLIVTPPFWQTSWFYVLSALLITGIILTIYRLRVRSIRQRNKMLEREVAERTDELKKKNIDLEKTLKELEETKDELVEKAHKAGMADIATGVIHNVGNILNSVNTSAEMIKESVKKSNVEKLCQANSILRKHIDEMEEFISNDPKGMKLMEYYLALEEPLKNEMSYVLQQSERLSDKINLISEVISAQQSHVGADIQADQTSLLEMIDNALTLLAGSIERHGIVIEKDLQATDPIVTQRSKLIHVLVNIFKNAKEAMADYTTNEKNITIKTWQGESYVYLSVSDNGPGIKPEHLDKIFTHGFTTKKNGHGFGLHNTANSMNEMGGKIEVQSEGEGKGTTFILSFPVHPISAVKNPAYE
ncbi:MAG: two-component regulator propeller domain-containing protein [Balneolaceae bacterium]